MDKLKSLPKYQVGALVLSILVLGYCVYTKFIVNPSASSTPNGSNSIQNTQNNTVPSNVVEGMKGNSNSNKVVITFYGFGYCGYCKKFQPIWDEAKNKNYSNNVEFRQFTADKLSDGEKQKIPNFVESKYAPNVILTVDGKNVAEFDQQPNLPLKGIVEFIESLGKKHNNPKSPHI